MPRRTDIQSVLLIGSGPIIIGQACEFDYSGVQACKALREEGYRVILVNSNPATIMTDPDFADRTYIEPITAAFLEKVIEKERPDALLPTMGGQTALNMAVVLTERRVLDRYGVKLIGASFESINRAENRDAFKTAMARCNLAVPLSMIARSKQEALKAVAEIGFPAIIRPSFTLGGTGGSIVYNREEFEDQVIWGLGMSPTHEILVEQSVLGWKEFELEVMRDRKDNVVIICSIENFDPMGIHTGDSITVAPAQTLTDKEYQRMRDAAIRIIREIGVETGGSNIQFAVNPETGEMIVIEMNPRVSRSSALASKATGFPIAKMATKLAVGYSLDEIQNDITKATPASFEPTIDYVVVKMPRFAFEKFPLADSTLTTQMKSVGEAMAIGRTFREALHKAIRSLEIDRSGLMPGPVPFGKHPLDGIRERLSVPTWDRLWTLADAFRYGMTVSDAASATRIDPWFLEQVASLVEYELTIKKCGHPLPVPVMREAKRLGFSDERMAELLDIDEEAVEGERLEAGVEPVYKRVDTCGAEFEAKTRYLYSTYESECEADPTDRRKIMILGGGPNRIGQGIEFDYCCVHAAFALREEGIETLMVNCNPETVSTDYDTSDRLYFEPLTREDVLAIIRKERPEGVVVQFGGQTPLKLAVPLERAGVKILGTTPDSIDRAEDRERFKVLLEVLGLRQPQSGIAHAAEEALRVAREIGYPVIVRPSYVLGGRAMEVVYDERSLEEYITLAVKASHKHPVLIDKYLEDAIEVDVDAISDGEIVVVGGIMEHIEEAGVHSGDSACSLPAYSLNPSILAELSRQTKLMALELGVVGLMNVQFALKDDEVYVLEVNPRASRTIPFVSKAIGIPLAKYAMKVIAGRKLSELGFESEIVPTHMAVKEAVFPFNKFTGVDTILGPEMKSTGEVMGLADDFGTAFAKSQIAAGSSLPSGGTAFISVKDKDKPSVVSIARKFVDLGFTVMATAGTAEFLKGRGVPTETVFKVNEGRPNIVDHMKNDRIRFVVNTVGDKVSQRDSYDIRRTALNLGIPYVTTLPGARATVRGIDALSRGITAVKSLQAYHVQYMNRGG